MHVSLYLHTNIWCVRLVRVSSEWVYAQEMIETMVKSEAANQKLNLIELMSVWRKSH